MAENPFDWQQFLVYAQSVDLQGASEATLRSVVSRAYYAAYWKARRRRVERQHFTVPRQNAHQEVWDRYALLKNADGTPLQNPARTSAPSRLPERPHPAATASPRVDTSNLSPGAAARYETLIHSIDRFTAAVQNKMITPPERK